MANLFRLGYSAVLIIMLMFLSGHLGPVLNIKQIVAAEVLYLIAIAMLGWFTAEYTEGFARMLSAYASVIATVVFQIVLIILYALYNWIMA